MCQEHSDAQILLQLVRESTFELVGKLLDAARIEAGIILRELGSEDGGREEGVEV